MKWELKEIEIGDIVRIPMSEMYHYGVCTGKDQIVQFGEPVLTAPKPSNEIRVMAVDIATFLGGAFAEVAVLDRKEKKRRKPTEEIVAYAQNSIGKGGYDILYNNCEHFANECVFGVRSSSQIDTVRQEIERKMPTINVYVGEIEDFCNTDELPRYVKKKLKSIKNERVAMEKKAPYGLLSLAAERMEIKPDIKKCYLSKTGKPLHKKFCFSISHSSGLAAVATAAVPVGIDLEICENKDKSERLKERIFHENEKEGDPLVLWTIKEAAFKFAGTEEIFKPSSIDTTKIKSKTVKFCHKDKEYILSVVGDVLLNVHYYSEPGRSDLL